MDSNTCWMIFGTSDISTKAGPFHVFLYVENAQKIQENMDTALSNMKSEIFQQK